MVRATIPLADQATVRRWTGATAALPPVPGRSR